jgi:hypothetical protein
MMAKAIAEYLDQLQALHKDLNDWFEELKEDNPEKFEEVMDLGLSFYFKRITDGEPHSFGNATDCYDDGFDMGYKQGQYEMLTEMFGDQCLEKVND